MRFFFSYEMKIAEIPAGVGVLGSSERSSRVMDIRVHQEINY